MVQSILLGNMRATVELDESFPKSTLKTHVRTGRWPTKDRLWE
jgi:hypothetical protein